MSSSDCAHAHALPVTLVKGNFLFCPACGISYTRRPREANKLFTFGMVGRSTPTDVLISNAMRNLDEDERKVISFSDNRQDTALQAAHLNDLQKRLAFRRALYHTLRQSGCTDSTGDFMELSDVGLQVFRTLEAADCLPEYRKDRSPYRRDRQAERRYQRYLEFAAMIELEATHRYTHQNLEDVGLLKVGYLGLDQFAADDAVWAEGPVLGEMDVDVRYDYLLGFLNIMRGRLALRHDAFLRPNVFENDVLRKLNEAALIHGRERLRTIGFSDVADTRRGWPTVYRFTGRRTSLVAWTRRALETDHASACDLIPQVVQALADERAAFLTLETVGSRRFRQDLYMVNPDVISLQASDETRHQVCPKCGTLHHFQALGICTGINCAQLNLDVDLSRNYFGQQYSLPLEKSVPLKAAEHSGQVQGEDCEEIEAQFKDSHHPLNVLVWAPTMELGIDIGDLSTIHMRNVPPSASHYAQRAGRAGRKGQPSLVAVFCGVGFARGPHDQYF